MILHGIEYQRPTSLNMRILADHVTYSFLAFMKSIFHFCLGCYGGGYSQNGRSNLSSLEMIYSGTMNSLTAWLCYSTRQNLVSIGPVNRLVPDGTRPLPDLNLQRHVFTEVIWNVHCVIQQKMLQQFLFTKWIKTCIENIFDKRVCFEMKMPMCLGISILEIKLSQGGLIGTMEISMPIR